MSRLTMTRRTWVALACVAQLGILGAAVAGPLSARLTGEEILLRVEPVDPIDPFRGAYAALSYPDLRAGEGSGTLFVPLTRDGEVWRGGEPSRTRPAAGTFVRCQDQGWRLRCGIESWFLPEGRAAEVQGWLAGGQAVAVVRVDARGNAALVEVRPRGQAQASGAGG